MSVQKFDSGNVLIKFEYFIDGSSNLKELGEDKIPEIKGVFGVAGEENRQAMPKAAYLNAKFAKVYIAFPGNADNSPQKFFVYSIDLNNSSARKISEEDGSVP